MYIGCAAFWNVSSHAYTYIIDSLFLRAKALQTHVRIRDLVLEGSTEGAWIMREGDE